MSFFTRNRDELSARGIDPARVPPGQYVTERFPVLHAGVIPEVDLATWDFSVDGLVATEKRWMWDEFRSLPNERLTADIHCVTKWSKLDTEWEGIPVRSVWDQLEPDPAANDSRIILPQDDLLKRTESSYLVKRVWENLTCLTGLQHLQITRIAPPAN